MRSQGVSSEYRCRWWAAHLRVQAWQHRRCGVKIYVLPTWSRMIKRNKDSPIHSLLHNKNICVQPGCHMINNLAHQCYNLSHFYDGILSTKDSERYFICAVNVSRSREQCVRWLFVLCNAATSYNQTVRNRFHIISVVNTSGPSCASLCVQGWGEYTLSPSAPGVPPLSSHACLLHTSRQIFKISAPLCVKRRYIYHPEWPVVGLRSNNKHLVFHSFAPSVCLTPFKLKQPGRQMDPPLITLNMWPSDDLCLKRR